MSKKSKKLETVEVPKVRTKTEIDSDYTGLCARIGDLVVKSNQFNEGTAAQQRDYLSQIKKLQDESNALKESK